VFGVGGFGTVWLEVGSSEPWRARRRQAGLPLEQALTSLWPVDFCCLALRFFVACGYERFHFLLKKIATSLFFLRNKDL
jgi:hypothetical protein